MVELELHRVTYEVYYIRPEDRKKGNHTNLISIRKSTMYDGSSGFRDIRGLMYDRDMNQKIQEYFFAIPTEFPVKVVIESEKTEETQNDNN